MIPERPEFTICISLGNSQYVGLFKPKGSEAEHLGIWDYGSRAVIDLGIATKSRIKAVSRYIGELEIHGSTPPKADKYIQPSDKAQMSLALPEPE